MEAAKFDPAATAASLNESAFDFLERALAEFDRSPKFSTIHFSTAVELFLKARLMKEHWALVFENPDKASRRAFSDGSARTVSVKGALERLSRVAAVIVPDQASAAFISLSEHRNRMIHFVHESTNITPDKGVLQAIAKEQSVGWFHLSRLIRDWLEKSSHRDRRLDAIERLMRGHKTYLRTAFNELRPEIERLKASGNLFVQCESCQLPAAAKTDDTDKLSSTTCLVCGQADWLITLECPDEECGREIEISGMQDQQPVCDGCGHVFLDEDFREQLDSEWHWEDHHSSQNINCAHCSSLGSAVRHENNYICSECRAVESTAPTCGWCNERQMGGGNLEGSDWSGCEFCEGREGWDSD